MAQKRQVLNTILIENKELEPEFETDDPKEAAKEILRRLIRIDDVGIPISKNISLLLGLI